MNRKFTFIATKADAPKLPAPLRVAIDLETTGLDPLTDRIVGVSFAVDDVTGYYCPDVSIVAKILAAPGIAKIFHNAVFDVCFLKKAG
jgi:ribonuclease D